MPADDSSCDGCERRHVDVWWTITARGRFRCYCDSGCWAHFVGVYLP